MAEQGCAITLNGITEDRVDELRGWSFRAIPVAGDSAVGHGGVRSLYAMLRFYAEGFARVYRLLGGMRNLLQRMGIKDIQEEDYRLLNNLVTSLLVRLSPLQLPVSTKMAERFRGHCEQTFSAGTLSSELEQLFNVIESELESVIFIQIPKYRQAFYEPTGSLLDESVVVTLSTVISDIEEASKCFAVGRNTACVFHLMRVMEIGVQAVGKKLRISLVQEKNWQNILDQVNKAIKNMSTKTAKRKLLQSEYGAIAAHLFNVKIAWRNSVMHPKASYTEEEAEEVLRAVLVFINHLGRTLRSSG